jgi:hypothetical protein
LEEDLDEMDRRYKTEYRKEKGGLREKGKGEIQRQMKEGRGRGE